MRNTWFTADFHLGHRNIIRYCQRPFLTVAEMDDAILENLNAAVREQDDLYFLGDFCLGSAQRAAEYRRRVRCENIYFVEGNHDAGARKIQAEFRWWKPLAEIAVGAQVVVLCHYAMRVWHHSFRGAWHLYGHSHGRLPDDPASLSMDIGVDSHGFRPWHFDEVKARMEEKRKAVQPASAGVEVRNELL
jgi:calcineurin-like phosphoesterase family protein